MIGLFSNSTDPKFNLATEEFLLKTIKEDVFFLYVNTPSIVVGKHQNTLAEINLKYVNATEISVHRRLSGGGTVYHDEGNLNFCFILNGEKGKLVDFAKHTQPIINALNALNITAVLGKRHDVLINGKKVSGNASHVYKNRVMHHGTLLFDSELDILNQALKTNPRAFKDKAVKSVRSEVTNINSYLKAQIDFKAFSAHVYTYLLNHFSNAVTYQLNSIDRQKIQLLVDEKYSTWEWNYGYSPSYEVKKRIRTESNIIIKSHFHVEKGIIHKLYFKTQNNNYEDHLQIVANSLVGIQHDPNIINNKINNITKSTNSLLNSEILTNLLF
ncbi:MAG: lipoate--protein ligase [Marinilabiliaceae bacterium]|nr:lipoate--protein ligase [Marinilabiliaceae bacterium]